MSEADSSPGERPFRLEKELLTEILTRHQHFNHLTQDELIVRMEGGATGTERNAVLDALEELRRSGLIRLNGEVVEPTLPILCAAEIFEFP